MSVLCVSSRGSVLMPTAWETTVVEAKAFAVLPLPATIPIIAIVLIPRVSAVVSVVALVVTPPREARVIALVVVPPRVRLIVAIPVTPLRSSRQGRVGPSDSQETEIHNFTEVA